MVTFYLRKWMCLFLLTGVCCALSAGCQKEAPAVDTSPKTQPEDTIQKLATACDEKEYAACFELGDRYRTAHGVKEDLKRSVTLFDRACAGGFARSCTSLGVSYLRGRGVAKDAKKAIALFLKSCDEGWPLGCYTLAGRYWTGEGTLKDLKKAEAYFQKACDAGRREGCRGVQSVRKDPQYGK